MISLASTSPELASAAELLTMRPRAPLGPLWRHLLALEAEDQAEALVVVEAGPSGLLEALTASHLAEVVGLVVGNPAEAVELCASRAGAVAVAGPLDVAHTWREVARDLPRPADLVALPAGELYRLPHARQVEALRGAGAVVRDGGLVVAEVPIPPLDLAEQHRIGGCYDVAGGSALDGWVCRTATSYDGAARTARVVSDYGPAGGAAERRTVERLWWRRPAELPALAYQAGLGTSRLLMPGVAGLTWGSCAILARC